MYITIATEDELSELVTEKIISEVLPQFRVGLRLRRGGFGYLRSRIRNFNQMAEREPVIVLTDLDLQECAKSLIDSWIPAAEKSPQLLLRVAVREVEAWLMADREAFAANLGINPLAIPNDVESLIDPKAHLLHLARGAPPEVRQALLVAKGAVASQGLGYNRVLGGFVIDAWSPRRAAENSDSLNRCCERLAELAR